MTSMVDRARAAFSVRYNAAAFRRAIPVEVEVPMVTIGDLSYGGYAIPAHLLDTDSVLVSVGAGTDVSFELEVVSRYGCRAFIYDPVPASAAYTEKAPV